MIAGMDWLQAFSPMKVDWHAKWISTPYGSGHIRLQGLLPESSTTSVIQLLHIAASSSSSDTFELMPVIQELVDEFADLFLEPIELPP